MHQHHNDERGRTGVTEVMAGSPADAIEIEMRYGAHNYHPLPVVIARGKGSLVWDLEGKEYFDFLSAYSAVNQGHCHPRIIAALEAQARTLTLTSRAFYNDRLGTYEKYVCELFGYERMLPMNSGAEAVETAVKLARKWAYEKKGVPDGDAVLIVAEGNFHGRTTGMVSLSSDPQAYGHYGPFLPGVVKIPYNNAEALSEALTLLGDRAAAFLVEPIQGEAGVIVPEDGYLADCSRLCREHNTLLLVDEIQTGLGRTGKMLASEWDSVRPDVLILGKALSGGVLPVSAVLADEHIMSVIQPGQHGSTFGGSPLAAAVATEALAVVADEHLPERAQLCGVRLRERLSACKAPEIRDVRGRGLLNAVEVDEQEGRGAWEICLELAEHGVLCKPTHGNIIRLAPPLVITDAQLEKALDIIAAVLEAAPSS